MTTFWALPPERLLTGSSRPGIFKFRRSPVWAASFLARSIFSGRP
jgi:hypothetical protein